MPETENDKTVELDTSGPGANVELPETINEEDKTFENEVKKNEANMSESSKLSTLIVLLYNGRMKY